MPHDVLQQRKCLREMRRAPVCALELVEQLVAVEVRRQLSVAHIQRVRIAFQRQREHHVLAVQQHAVSVDPAFLRVLDVVVDDEQVDRGDELEVADVREEVRLHDRQLHPLSVTPLAHVSTYEPRRNGNFVDHRHGKIGIDRQTEHLLRDALSPPADCPGAPKAAPVHRKLGDQRIEITPRVDAVLLAAS